MFNKPKKIKHYYPITAFHINDIWQFDHFDMFDIWSVNYNFNYLLMSIDVFSRYLSAMPLKNKSAPFIIVTFKIMKGTPRIINSDNESEFISREFKN